MDKTDKTESIILKIRSIYDSLTKAEKKVADVVLDKADEIIYDSITELAEKCNVGETTIIRFCRKIGLSGYQEFKLLLARDLVVPEENLHENISANDDLETLVQKIAADNIQVINNTTKILSITQLENAVNAIINAQRIEIYGVGASSYTAFDAMYKFKRLGLFANTYPDAHMQAMSATTLSEKDVAIGISFSGSTRDTVHSLEIAKKAGAKVICITNHARSPITKYADIVLLTSIKETPLRSGALTSKIAQLYILDILYTAVAMRIKEKALENINKTAEAVLDKLY